MDRTSVGLLFSLSVAVTVFMCLVVVSLVGVESVSVLTRGRIDAPLVRDLMSFGLLASAVVIMLLAGRLARRRHPGSPIAALSPELLLGRVSELAASARARCSAAIHRRRRGARVRKAELAAVEAAEDDDRLSPERIRTTAEALFRLVQLASDAHDRKRLATLLGPELLLESERVLDARRRAELRQRRQLLGDVQIDLVGLARKAAGGATAIVLVEAELDVHVENWHGRRVYFEGLPAVQRLRQYWTISLGGDGRWMVHEIEERTQGDRHLREPIAARRAPGA